MEIFLNLNKVEVFSQNFILIKFIFVTFTFFRSKISERMYLWLQMSSVVLFLWFSQSLTTFSSCKCSSKIQETSSTHTLTTDLKPQDRTSNKLLEGYFLRFVLWSNGFTQNDSSKFCVKWMNRWVTESCCLISSKVSLTSLYSSPSHIIHMLSLILKLRVVFESG